MTVRHLLIAAIRAYQRHLSPHKGFSCAYRAHTGRASCSALGIRVIRRHGVVRGLVLLRRRLTRCGIAHRRYSAPRHPAHRLQHGFCDAGCDFPCDLPDIPCHLPHIDVCGMAGDCAGCDWPTGSRKQRARERYVHIPPSRKTRPSE